MDKPLTDPTPAPVRRRPPTAAAPATAPALVLAMALAAGMACAQPAAPASGPAFSLELRAAASEAELGVARYPGARARVHDSGEHQAFTFGLWKGRQGARVVVQKYLSDDALEAVVGHYRRALAVHGPVFDCGAALPVAQPLPSGHAEACAESKPTARAQVLRAGPRSDQRIVQVERQGARLHIDVVRVQRGD